MAADDKNINTSAGNGILDLEAFKRKALEIDAMEEGPEKERQKFLLSQDYEGLKEIYGADLVSSEAMFNERMPEGRNAGGVYVAANPLEFLSSALRQGIGASGRRNTMDKLKQLSADKAEGIGNMMFGQGGQTAQGQVDSNIVSNQTQAQKPDYRQYGYGDPLVRAGMAQLQGRDVPQHVQNADNRRAAREKIGLPVGERGTGPVGQLKQAVGITPRSEALRAMGGMGKPDLSRYGAPDIGAGMGQQTERVPAIPFGAGVRPDQLTKQKQSIADIFMSGDTDPSIASQRRTQFNADNNTNAILFDLINRRDRR